MSEATKATTVICCTVLVLAGHAEGAVLMTVVVTNYVE